MMRYCFILAMCFLHVFCSRKPVPHSGSKALQASSRQYLALGDSYTIGEGVTSSQTYPQLLVDALKAKQVDFGSPVVIARTGWATADLLNAIEKSNLKERKFDLVSLLIGVNNEFQGRDLEEFEQQFRELLYKAIAFASGDKRKVFVLSIPDYGYTPFGNSDQPAISARIDVFNQKLIQITQSEGVAYYDITGISRKAISDNSLIAGDGLHPSGKMYAEFVREIEAKVIRQAGLQ